MRIDAELLNIIVKIVISVIGVLVTYYLIPWFKSNVDANKWKEALDFIEKCVEAAEKKFTPDDWKMKKEYVLTLVTDRFKALGIEISNDEIDALIEGFVKAVKG